MGVYYLDVLSIDKTGDSEDYSSVKLVCHGKLTTKTKREIVEAIRTGNVSIIERPKVLA